jgi:hypothetical protein
VSQVRCKTLPVFRGWYLPWRQSRRLAALPAPADPGGRVRTDPDRLAEVFATLGDPGLERAGALRRAGRLAVIASTGTQEAAIARMRFLVGAVQWPSRTCPRRVDDGQQSGWQARNRRLTCWRAPSPLTR